MIKCLQDNILVQEIVKDSKAGVLTVSQDESSAYMFCKVLDISDEALQNICDFGSRFDEDTLQKRLLDGDYILVIRRTAKDPFIQNKFFISYKDLRAVIDKEYFEEI